MQSIHCIQRTFTPSHKMLKKLLSITDLADNTFNSSTHSTTHQPPTLTTLIFLSLHVLVQITHAPLQTANTLLAEIHSLTFMVLYFALYTQLFKLITGPWLTAVHQGYCLPYTQRHPPLTAPELGGIQRHEPRKLSPSSVSLFRPHDLGLGTWLRLFRHSFVGRMRGAFNVRLT